MRLAKLLTLITTPTLVLSSVGFSLTGCAKMPPKPSPEPEITDAVKDYIDKRTFSIMGTATPIGKTGELAATWGTAWVISDSTPEVKTDNQFYLVTNWHVKASFDELQDKSKYTNFHYYYADNSLAKPGSDGIINHSDYHNFLASSFEPVEVSKFLYSESSKNEQAYVGIDLAVYNANFYYDFPSSMSEKFHYFRTLSEQGKMITEFIKSDDESALNQNKFVGGYPVKDKPSKEIVGGKWECRGLNPNDFTYCEKFDEEEWHFIADKPIYKGKKVVDNSAQYVTDCNYGTDWMTGGASGSMVITEDLKVCGIYWGGQVDKQDKPSWFKPRFSLFKAADDDFLKDWEQK